MGKQITLIEMIKECEDEQKTNSETTETPKEQEKGGDKS
jgi:hypothetical protein